MIKKQQKDLMDQIVAIYEVWASLETDSEHYARLINGLFNIAREIDDTRMSAAFSRGAKLIFLKDAE